MATYVYETTDTQPVRRFEIRQSMNDKPLVNDPETGRPVRRVISGGYGIMSTGTSESSSSSSSSSGSCCHSGGCGCS